MRRNDLRGSDLLAVFAIALMAVIIASVALVVSKNEEPPEESAAETESVASTETGGLFVDLANTDSRVEKDDDKNWAMATPDPAELTTAPAPVLEPPTTTPTPVLEPPHHPPTMTPPTPARSASAPRPELDPGDPTPTAYMPEPEPARPKTA